MAAVHDAIENRVGEGRSARYSCQCCDRQLTGDDGRLAGGAIVEHFEQIAAFGLADGSHGPVVEDQDVDLGELREASAEAAVAVGDAQFFEQAVKRV